MSRRKSPYKPKPFESTGVKNDTSANVYRSMLESPAYKALTKNQRLLYVYMKSRYYGARKPGKDFPDIEELQGEELFYFNRKLAVEFALYSKANERQFYRDVAALEEHGFIRTVSNGRETKSRSVYSFSDEWQTWSDSS